MLLTGIEPDLGMRLAQLAAMAMHGDFSQANNVGVAHVVLHDIMHRSPNTQCVLRRYTWLRASSRARVGRSLCYRS